MSSLEIEIEILSANHPYLQAEVRRVQLKGIS